MAAAVESAAFSPQGGGVISVRQFEATPNLSRSMADGDVVATTKEEEWVTKKKTELTTTRQIETRVKRQLVLEDGKVVVDSGPLVSTNTTEDTEKQEHQHTEHKTTGDEPPGEGWVALPLEGDGLVREVRERTVHSNEQQKHIRETEQLQTLGDLSEQSYSTAVQNQQDVRSVLRRAEEAGALVSAPRLVHESRSTRRVVDTDDAQELSRVHQGGVITETRRTTEHEETQDDALPEDGASEDEREIDAAQGSQRFAHTKEQALVTYLGTGGRVIGEQMRYQAENVEGNTEGLADPEWESLSTRMQKARRQQVGVAGVPFALAEKQQAALAAAQARKDALTKRPLDLDAEEETRKVETSKWLEHHFGSDSRSSKSSLDEPPVPSAANFINVTMKSRPVRTTPTPPEQKTRVFLSSSPEVPLPPPPVMPPTTAGTKVEETQRGSSGGGSANFFQGVSEWAERRPSPPALTLASNNVSPRVSSLVQALNRANATTSPTQQLGRQQAASPAPVLSAAPSHALAAGRASSPVMGYTSNHSARPVSPPQQELRSYEEEQVTWKGRTATTSAARQQLARGQLDSGTHQRLDRHRSVELLRSRENLAKLERRYSSPRELEPPPDYSPKHQRRRGHSSPSPSPPLHNQQRKLNQKTRFADQHHQQQQHQQKSSFSSFGDSLRRLVGKLRSGDKKNKPSAKVVTNNSTTTSTTHHNHHQQPRRANDYSTGSEGEERPRPPPRHRQRYSSPPQHRQQHYRSDMEPRRYYLGEDPFGGSIYGREKEYDGVTPPGERSRRTHRTSELRRGSQDGVEEVRNLQQLRAGTHSPPRMHTTTLGRYSRSTGRLQHQEESAPHSTQTLPRKLSSSKNNSQPQKPLKSAGSMINVSIVNRVSSPPMSNGAVNGPAKPARTYRSNLARSQSFNVVEAPAPRRLFQQQNAANNNKSSAYFRSNPHLHKLEENGPELKSPGIISSISRSQRDIHEEVQAEETVESKKKLFMKGLLDRAPELYRTLHGQDTSESPADRPGRVTYSSSFRSDLAPGVRPARRPSNNLLSPSSSFRNTSANGDYTETHRFSSSTDDPIRPSVTNTVQSFSKKRVASPRGMNGAQATQTVQSTETTTVTKSSRATPSYLRHYQVESPPRTGGVVIEVGNHR
ncbi:serine/arginine repetitive matrix protein 2 isoform X2 [Neocloeon triangulifer]|uniref:serine/arginine repetitive matrix protein 2 isoform X2 n=1 Tax=Neocloeon triangulifer TaxID=2078957 RepID=UPI00286F0AA5|nr:serine/arginine repetitive matrix protein 2 isoform X2 [Neocloeon triangulifer]